MAKKDDIIELIKITNLHSKTLDLVIPNLVKTAILTHGKVVNEKEVVKQVKSRILEQSFVEKFVPSFDEKFTQEEIRELLDFYKSALMKKFSAYGENLITPIYTSFSKIILEVLDVDQ